jgi:hypothetical protein
MATGLRVSRNLLNGLATMNDEGSAVFHYRGWLRPQCNILSHSDAMAYKGLLAGVKFA